MTYTVLRILTYVLGIVGTVLLLFAFLVLLNVILFRTQLFKKKVKV